MASCCEKYNCKPPSFFERLFQKSSPKFHTQELKKCLNIFDLTVQGLAHIVGAGIFIMTPGVTKMVAGPGLVVSYLLAAAVLIFTVLAYMDLEARYKGIGNAYVYVYAALGEFAAGLVGTFIMTEIALGVGLVAVGFGQNMDKFIFEDTETGRGGVFPYGFSDVITGAAVVVVSFAGFETVAHGLTIPKYIIVAAILFASGSVALCSLTTLARGLMVFSDDGLIFSCLGLVAECTKEVIDESSELILNEFVVNEEQPLTSLNQQDIETLGYIENQELKVFP
ncbi:cationic amino acid transporter 4-like [Bolinopsis microptera]|uniref:cationic amino acid transporter 4-like n=1 Tax=Bolinopsis microptera TaxID=2820187 RepID=UPI003079741F